MATKVVTYINDEGLSRRALLPEDAPNTDAAKGIPLGLDLSALETRFGLPAAFVRRLEAAYEAQGITTIDDLNRPGAYQKAENALRRTLKTLNNEIVDFLRSEA